jgi:hypothetical protein
MTETSLQENIWFGLPGALARKAVEERSSVQF